MAENCLLNFYGGFLRGRYHSIMDENFSRLGFLKKYMRLPLRCACTACLGLVINKYIIPGNTNHSYLPEWGVLHIY